MKKNYIYIFLVIILLVISLPLLKEDNKTFKINGVKYAVSVDGEEKKDFPAKVPYDVIIQCTNADSKWDYENWETLIYNINGEVSCNISFTMKDKVTLNTYIKDELTGTTQGLGQVVNENGYRYEGENPNNYIRFNNELWRIIGVFDASSHGQTGKYLTKIIRNDSIGAYAWDGNNVNIWPTSSLYKILNNYYYIADNGTESGYCYKYSTTLTGDCDFKDSGINATYRPMVEKVTWHLGGFPSASNPTSSMYISERGTEDKYYYSDNTGYKTVANYVGLMYTSDYGYSVLSSSCPRTTNMSSYNTDACAGKSWLFKEGEEWTITHRTSFAVSNFYLDGAGRLNSISDSAADIGNSGVNNGYATRPVLYLDSNVYILNGDGSRDNPYIINM